MAISNSNGTRFVRFPKGTGESTLYKTDIVGQLVGLEPRDGVYTVTDRKTGQPITRPNSWTAHFADGSRFSWPTYVDEAGRVQPWSRYDPSIDLDQCVSQGILIHLWKDEHGFTHLELAASEEPLPF